ncbi:hypothetical protein FACS1894199_04490 [Bacteroidia bacterium]|nr:hypothetical protein FACS1894199_04490 [Bacteroidia bacterium]
MRKIQILIITFLILSVALFAQSPANRTASTIVADVLAQMPAQQTEQYYNQFKDLSTTGEEGVLQLVGMLNAGDKATKIKVEYALSGLSRYATGEGLEAVRLATAKSLVKGLEKLTNQDTKAFVISLIGIVGKDEVVPALITYLDDVPLMPELKNQSLSIPAARALASIGSPTALKALSEVVKLTPRETPLSEKEAKKLQKKAKKSGVLHERIYALGALMHANPDNVPKLLKTALKDPDRKYRCAALTFALDYPNVELFIQVSNYMEKASPDLKIDILNWFSIVYDKKLLTIEPFFSNLAFAQLPTENVDVKKAAIALSAKVNNPESTQYLAKMLSSPDEQDIQLAKEALLTKKGNISDAVASVISTATDAGKIAGLKLLAHRKADKHLDVVLNMTNSGSAEVQAAAYTALKDVVPAEKKLDFFSSQMNKVGADKQYLYYPLLASTNAAQALDILTKRFYSESGKAQEVAFQALLDWKGVATSDDDELYKNELYKIAQNKSVPQYNDRAIDKYIQLADNHQMTGENRRLLLIEAFQIARTDAQKNKILFELKYTNSFLALLLAGQYLEVPALQQRAAETVMKLALDNKFSGKNVKDLLNKVMPILNNPDADYQRQAIRKYLGEMADEEGFVSIFNGKDLTGWKGLVGDPISRPKMKVAALAKAQKGADEQMRQDWKVENGLLVFDGKGYDNICTEKLYGDFEMFVDWKLEPSPDADAGVYLRGTPQVQMWNIARTDVGAEVGSGGLYNNKNNPSKPLKVADNKLGEWNTLYIKMVGDRVTVKLNGELVVDNIMLENFWDRSQPIPAVEQIELQAHGSKVYYRNVYVKELERPAPFELSAQEKKEGYKVLFDGTNMHEWKGNTVDYRIEEACISLRPDGNSGGNLYTTKEYGNFIFRFEFQLPAGANNGVGIRTEGNKDAAYNGMEIQILDHKNPIYKWIKPYQAHGSVYGVIASDGTSPKIGGEWNYEEIVADGDHIKVTLNGKVILDGNIREAAKNGTIDKEEHPGLFNKTGYIGFLGHGSNVKFKNIRIKELR